MVTKTSKKKGSFHVQKSTYWLSFVGVLSYKKNVSTTRKMASEWPPQSNVFNVKTQVIEIGFSFSVTK